MGQLRTANKRRNRALTRAQATPPVAAQPTTKTLAKTAAKTAKA